MSSDRPVESVVSEQAGLPGGDQAERRSAFTVASGILVSRLTGLLRQTAFAHYFGDTAQADAFNVALRIPNALRNLLGEGSVGAAFIPVYSALIERDERASRVMANTVLGFLLAVVSALTIIGIAVTPWLVMILAPGYGDQPEQLALVIRLTRVLFPMAGLMVISGWCLGVQNSHRRFFWSYASAALWSVAQIALLVGFGGRAESLEQLAWWLAWATLVGSVLQIIAQLPEVLKLLGVVRPAIRRNIEGVAPVLRNFVPVVAAVGVVQLSAFVDQAIATFLVEGAVTNLFYANTLALLPVSLFGISVVASSLPELSRSSAVQRTEALLARVRTAWMRLLFFIVPSAVVLIVLGDYCAGIVYRSGRFGAEQQTIVHYVLAAYAVGLISFASVRLLASVFHAQQDYATPLRASVLSLSVSAVAAAAIALPMRHSVFAPAAIALGSALGSYSNFVFLMYRIRRTVGGVYTREMWSTTFRIFASAIVAALVVLPLRAVLDPSSPRLWGPVAIGVYGVVFLLSAWLLGSEEAGRLLRLKPRRSGVQREKHDD